jgi:hypothetical protein
MHWPVQTTFVPKKEKKLEATRYYSKEAAIYIETKEQVVQSRLNYSHD